MKRINRTLFVALMGLVLFTPLPAMASGQAQAIPVVASSSAPHASVRLTIDRDTAYVGQAIPFTVVAYFKRVSRVVLQGPPQITSKSIVTTELADDPIQETHLVGGEPSLSVKWKGTISPQQTGPLDLSVRIDAQLQYRKRSPSPASSFGDSWFDDMDDFDLFGMNGFGMNSFDPNSMFKQMQQRMQRMQERVVRGAGQLHSQNVVLDTKAPPLTVRELPAANKPLDFTGAVGDFALESAASAQSVSANEPVTLRVTVSGDGDLSRVQLRGLADSDDWKAYPIKSTPSSSPNAAKNQKVFEQVLLPRKGGELLIPPVKLSTFNPSTEKYETLSTSPIAISVDGTPAAASQPSSTTPLQANKPPLAGALAAEKPSIKARLAKLVNAARAQGQQAWSFLSRAEVWWAGGFILVLLGVVIVAGRRLWRGRQERILVRRLRKAAKTEDVDLFYQTARRLIELRFERVSGMAPEQVTAKDIEQRLGDQALPLARVLRLDEARRFGRHTAALPPLDELHENLKGALRRVA